MRSVSIRALPRRCNLPSDLSWLRMDQVRIAQSPYARSEAHSDNQQPWPSATLGSPPLCQQVFTSSVASLSLLPPLSLSCPLLQLLAPMGVVERVVDLSTHPQAVQ